MKYKDLNPWESKKKTNYNHFTFFGLPKMVENSKCLCNDRIGNLKIDTIGRNNTVALTE